MIGKKEEGRYFISSAKIGPKGQIVIPKEAREMFGMEPGDIIALMADREKGIALQTVDKLHPYLKKVFSETECREDEET